MREIEKQDSKKCRIKICGLSRIEDIHAANEFQPDYIGFVFAKSSRKISPEQAIALRRELDSAIPAVGVFVNAPEEQIVQLAESAAIQMIQLHGDEGEEEICRLKKRTGLPIIKAVRIQTGAEIPRAEELSCDYLLLDTYTREQYGGSGKQFDWNLIPCLKKPFFLAGGISPENAVKAASSGAWCLDVSSAVETEGKKDRTKICQMIEIVRQINRVE